MSNLPINNFAPMTNTYLPQDREKPVVDKSRDPMLSKTVTNTVLPDNTVESKDGNITMNRATFDQLFDILESIFKAVRLWAGQGGIPKLTLDAGPLPKAIPEADLNAPVLKDTAAKTLPKADAGAKVTPESDPKAQMLKDIVAQTLPKADAGAKVTPEADPKAQLLKDIVAQTLPKADAGAKVTPEADPKAPLLKDTAAKILPDAAVMPRAMPEAKPHAQVVPGDDLKVSPDVVSVTKKLSGEVPEIKLDAAQQSKQTSDINLTVQVVNCGLHHPEVNILSHELKLDDQHMVLPKTPDKPKADDQRPSVPNTLDKPKADEPPPLVPNALDKPKTADKSPVTPNTPDMPMLNDQPSGPIPDIRVNPELTAPGPADDRSGDIFSSRSRNRFDNLWTTNAGRQNRA
ncbi:hypothetical protein [Pseudomonas sp. S09G 359]|jgi:hypothetical protein|uniref:hypothetical protein n=1 Tax=Pseudomonas sp. S09G 359 TaxID=2054919 RepID=UPI000C6C9543|nr:hypothetical protein [Pseudomonas sp. S09G 359]AUG08969.1 hypothetical protein CXQ82_21180 [Pseudomonas sp. S09G 359]